MFKIKNIKKSKIAAMATGAAVKIIIAVVCGALLLTGTYGVIKYTVLPNTKARTKAIADYNGIGGAGGGDFADYVKYTDDFEDGPVQSYFYGSLENAIADANNNTTANALSDVSGAKAKIEVKEKDGGYIVKPMADCNLATAQNISGTYTFDINGKTVSLAAGAEFDIVNGADITFRDSGEGKIFKSVTTANTEKIISVPSTNTSSVSVTFLNGNYECENNGAKNSVVYCVSNKKCSTYIKNCNFYAHNSAANAGAPRGAQIYGNIKIDNGTFTAICEGSNASQSSGIYLNNIVEGEINNAKSIAYNYTQNQKSLGITINSKFKSANPIVINGGTFCGDKNQLCNCVINSGNFYSICNMISEIIINGGYFSGVHSGVQTNSISDSENDAVVINGGTFESCNHGGAYFTAKKTIVKNADLKCINYTDLKAYECYLKKCYGDRMSSQYPQGAKLGAFYIGSPNNDATVYMDNCKLKGTVVLSSNNDYMNTYLYLSNTSFAYLRLDGLNSKGYRGNVYLGKNGTYKSMASHAGGEQAPIDTETYKNVSFTPEYVAKNFN